MQFKVLLIFYKVLHGSAPEYMCELIHVKQPSRTLRSSHQLYLDIPAARLRSYGDNSFMVAGPVLWNKLPETVRNARTLAQFKSCLKTHLFNCAY